VAWITAFSAGFTTRAVTGAPVSHRAGAAGPGWARPYGGMSRRDSIGFRIRPKVRDISADSNPLISSGRAAGGASMPC
jgi:hypothetical protein